MVVATYLTDATALSFEAYTLLVILFYLVREERIKDLVHQLGGRRFSRTLTVLLYLCRVTNGLSSSGSPVNGKQSSCSQEGSIDLGTNT